MGVPRSSQFVEDWAHPLDGSHSSVDDSGLRGDRANVLGDRSEA